MSPVETIAPDLELYRILKMKSDHRIEAASRLRRCLAPARRDSSRFTVAEWRTISAAYAQVWWDRVPWISPDAAVLANYAELGAPVTPITGLRQMCGSFSYMMAVYALHYLRSHPTAPAGADFEPHSSLVRKIVALSDAEVVGAHVILEAIRILPTGADEVFDPDRVLGLLGDFGAVQPDEPY